MGEAARFNSAKMIGFAVGVIVALAMAFALVAAHPATALAKTKYVKASVLVKSESKSMRGDREIGGSESVYRYNKNKLISECSSSSHYGGAAGISVRGFKYSKGKLSKVLDMAGPKDWFGSSVFTRDKKGRITKSVSEITYKTTNKYKYDKKNRISKVSFTYKFSTGKVIKGSSAAKYNKKGLISQIVTKGGYDDIRGTVNYTYDSRGMIKSVVKKGVSKTTYKNTYKSGKLVKSVATTKYNSGEESVVETTTYKYKTVKVPQKYAAQVKAQQKALFKVTFPTAEKELLL